MSNPFRIMIVLLGSTAITPASFSQGTMEDAWHAFHSGSFEKARTICQSRLTQNGDDGAALDLLGRICFVAHDWDQALENHEKAVRAQPNNIDFMLGLASVLGEKTREANFVSAIYWGRRWKSMLESAFALDPSHVQARTQLVYYLANAPGIGGGDKKRAQDLARGLVDQNEKEGRLLLGRVMEQSDRPIEAIREYEAALQIDSTVVSALNSLGYLYLNRKNYEKAESCFVRYVQLAPADPNAHDSLGDYFEERDRTKEAIEQYKKALAIDPNFAPSKKKLKKLQ